VEPSIGGTNPPVIAPEIEIDLKSYCCVIRACSDFSEFENDCGEVRCIGNLKGVINWEEGKLDISPIKGYPRGSLDAEIGIYE
jgi:hypothetical protein